jgi:WD40 repeat protein
LIAGAGEDKTARIWDAESGKVVRELIGHTRAVHLLIFSPDGRRIATEAADQTGKVWDVASGRELFTLEGLKGKYPALAFSPDGTRIAAESGDKEATVWDVETQRKLYSVLHDKDIRMIVFSPDGNLLVTASDDATAGVWDGFNGNPITVLRGHKKEVVAAAFSPDGKRIVTASLDGTARIVVTGNWDDKTTRIVSHNDNNADNDPIYDVQVSSSNNRIVTASDDRTARIWDLQGKLLQELAGHNGPVTSAAFSPDGQFVVTASGMDQGSRFADARRIRGDNTARVWNVQSGRQVAQLRGHRGAVTSAAFSPNGRYVVTGAWDGTVRIWATGTQSGVDLGTNREGAPRFSPVEKILAKSTGGAPGDASLGRDAGLFVTASPMPMSGQRPKLPKSEQQTFEERLRREASIKRQKIDIKVKDNGDNTVDISWTGSEGGVIRVWNNDQLLGTLLPRKGPVIRKAALSPNGRLVVIVYKDKVATLWDYARNWTEDLSGHTEEIYSADFNRSGTLVVTASADNTARVWNTASGKLVEELKGHTGKIYSADFNHSGNLVVTASADKTVRVWDTASGKQLDELKDHTDEVNRAVFSPKGDMIATTGDDNTARIRTWPKGKTLILRGHDGPVYDVTFSADGRFLLTASQDRSARIWDTATGESVETFSNRVQARFDWDSVSFGPEGKIIMIHPSEGGIKLFPCELCGSLDELRALAKLRVTRSLTPDERERYLPVSGVR